MSRIMDVMGRGFGWLAADLTRMGWLNVTASVATYLLYTQIGRPLFLDFASNVMIGAACYCFGAGQVTQDYRGRPAMQQVTADRPITINVSSDAEAVRVAQRIVAKRSGMDV